MVPAMLHMFVFIVIPIVIGLVISFFNYNPLSSDNKFIGLENFVRLVQDADFRKALLNTLLFVLITVTLNIGIALVVAQMISWFKSNKVRSFFRMVFFLPCIAPMVATSVVFARSIFPTTTGFLNVALNKIGIDSINWLGDPKVVMISLIIYTIWVDVGYNVILFSAGIDGIPSYVYEAADLDDRIEKVPLAVRIARRTVRIAWQNIIFALAVKLATLLLGALGYAEMWMALVADVGVCLIAILNAMRAMHPGK